MRSEIVNSRSSSRLSGTLPLPKLVSAAASSPANLSFAEKLRQATASLSRSGSMAVGESPSFLFADSETEGRVTDEEELSDSLMSDSDDDGNCSDIVAESDDLSEVNSETGLSKSQRIAGLLCSLGLCTAWLAMSLLASDFQSPLFSRYFVVSMYSCLLLLWFVLVRRRRRVCRMILAESAGKKHSDTVEYYRNNNSNDADGSMDVGLKKTLSQTKRANSIVNNRRVLVQTLRNNNNKQPLSKPFENHSETSLLKGGTSSRTMTTYFSTNNNNNNNNYSHNNANVRHSLDQHEKCMDLDHTIIDDDDDSTKERRNAKKILNEQLSNESIQKLIWELLPWCVPLSWLGTLNGWLWYLSLEQTDVAVNTCIFQSSCAFVYLLSCFVTKTARLTAQKTLSVSVCLLGVGLISMASENTSSSSDNDATNQQQSTTTMFGLALCVCAMLCYSGFVVMIEHVESKMFRRLVAAEDSILLNGMLGVSCLLFVWPLLVVCYLSGIDNLQVPLPWDPATSQDFFAMLWVSLADMTYVLFLMLGVSLSNAVLMSTGSLMVIPLSFFVDSVILQKYEPTLLGLLGALLICGGFFFLQVPLSDVIGMFERMKNWLLRGLGSSKKGTRKKVSLSTDKQTQQRRKLSWIRDQSG